MPSLVAAFALILEGSAPGPYRIPMRLERALKDSPVTPQAGRLK